MIISLIAARTQNGVIGKNNDLPWQLPDDMKYFMQITSAHYVVMGRKNYESIPEKFRPLPNRTNIIVTRQIGFTVPQCIVVHSLNDAVQLAKNNNQQELFIIGGSEIYQLAMPIANRLYITEIKTELQGDTFFPSFHKTEWKEISRKHHPADDRHIFAFDFVTYEKK